MNFRRTLLCLLLWCATGLLLAQHKTDQPTSPVKSGNDRSDTLDVINYDITLDLTLMSNQQIKGACTIDFISLMNNINEIHLDLEELTVDSVIGPNGPLDFTHNSPDLFITTSSTLSENDPYQLTVYYRGNPANDPTWGGFYFSLGYAYNMGVGFDADPHNYGRVWFPCFDNFVERSTYSVHVLTNGGRRAYCGGVRLSEETVGTDSLLTHWQLNQPIPTYLASIAATNYAEVHQNFTSINGDDIPIWLVAKAADTTAMKNSFVNLVHSLNAFENHYGRYRWPRVGYVVVPFSGGAMEHATNIAYPKFAVDGSLAYETLYAHEISHHWWGDNVTCRTAEDMWLNEGWASFSEALFTEALYGETAYIDYLKDVHKNVLLHAHQDDGGRYPVSPVPHEITYGTHVYQKGSIMAHALRHYMGDDGFFTACREFQEQRSFSDISSYDLRDFFQNYTAANLTDFFDYWIFQPGYPSFRINHFEQTNQQLVVHTEHKSHYGPSNYGAVPMQLTAKSADGSEIHFDAIIDEEFDVLELTLPESFAAHAVYLNGNKRLPQAVLGENVIFENADAITLDYAECSIEITDATAAYPLWVRAENHWSAAETPVFIPFTEYFISPDRWWDVRGTFPETGTSLTINYYGNSAVTANNYFDPLFFEYLDNNNFDENDLIVLYQPNTLSAWTEWTDFTINTLGSATNYNGKIEINNIHEGRYAWAVRTGSVSVGDQPNKAESTLTQLSTDHYQLISKKGKLTICDAHGKLLYQGKTNGDLLIDTASYASGVYFLQVNTDRFTIVK